MRIQITPLFSGSTGNCILVQAGGTNVLVDAGITAKALTGALAQTGLRMDDIAAVLITHEHADHIKGLPVLVKKYSTPVYATEGTWRIMHFSQGCASTNKSIPCGIEYAFGMHFNFHRYIEYSFNFVL